MAVFPPPMRARPLPAGPPVRRRTTLLLLGVIVVLAPSPGRAQAPTGGARPPGQSLVLGDPAGPSVPVRLLPGRRGGTVLQVGGRRYPLSRDRRLTELFLAPVDVAADRRVAVVIGGPRDAGVAAVLGGSSRRPELLWTASLAWQGEDLGERRRGRVDFDEDLTGDGFRDVVVGWAKEGVSPCLPERSLLDPHAVDPGSGRLRPVVLRRIAEPVPEARLARLPPDTPPPTIGTLRFQATSDPTSTDPAARLTDGDPGTVWQTYRGGDGRGEFVVGRFDGGRVAAVDLVSVGDGGPPRPPPPAELALVDAGGRAVAVPIPDDLRPGEVLRVEPPPDGPLFDGRCLALVVRRTRPSHREDGVALAEARAWSAVEQRGGVAAVVDRLGLPGTPGDQAADILAEAGAEGAEALEGAWDELPAPGRRRGARVAAGSARRTLHARVARDPNAAVRRAFLEAANRKRNAAALAALARSGTPEADEAALALVAVAGGEAVAVLADALAAPGGTERPGLREALRRAGRRVPEAVRARFGRAAQPPEPGEDAAPALPIDQAAALALALAPVDPLAPLVGGLLEGRAPTAETFPDRWRFVAAVAAAGPSVSFDADWLRGVAQASEEWMLREAALAALADRGIADPSDLLRGADDPNPRVRARAVVALGDRSLARERLLALARTDPWPLVRAAALEGLAEPTTADQAPPGGGSVFREALGDANKRVRAAALRGLAVRGDRGAWPLVQRRLRDRDEWPEVLEAAVRYVQATCREEAVAELQGLVGRTARPDPWDPDVGVAVTALAAMASLPGAEVDETLVEATSPLFPPAVRRAAERAQRERTPCR
ncbi:MAG TPA: HEAT repeat domain-containing protein [Polyangiaceae bacterium LLY-WYZ-14_1]|nr:HEAT repeat domain-containing protein [Polyangiaceae bacterium LLY-WYZ-14_1]